jgi:hypothetical protein
MFKGDHFASGQIKLETGEPFKRPTEGGQIIKLETGFQPISEGHSMLEARVGSDRITADL